MCLPFLHVSAQWTAPQPTVRRPPSVATAAGGELFGLCFLPIILSVQIARMTMGGLWSLLKCITSAKQRTTRS
jgi:hypothetical protein